MTGPHLSLVLQFVKTYMLFLPSLLASLLTGSLTLPSSPMVSPTVTNLSTLREIAFPNRCKQRALFYSSPAIRNPYSPSHNQAGN